MPVTKQQPESRSVLPAPSSGVATAILPTEQIPASTNTQAANSYTPVLLPPKGDSNLSNTPDPLAERRAYAIFRDKIRENLEGVKHLYVSSEAVNAELKSMTRERAISEHNNFVVFGATKEQARTGATFAEQRFAEISQAWGQGAYALRPPIIIGIRSGETLGAGGVMEMGIRSDKLSAIHGIYVQGPQASIESTIGHELNHLLFARHFNQRLPRWADEGAAKLSESPKEQENSYSKLIECLQCGRGIPFEKLFVISDYGQDDTALYAESRSAVEYLIKAGDAMQRAGTSNTNGHERFIAFLSDGLHGATSRKSPLEAWELATRKHYGEESIVSLQRHWNEWVLAGAYVVAEGDKYINTRYGKE